MAKRKLWSPVVDVPVYILLWDRQWPQYEILGPPGVSHRTYLPGERNEAGHAAPAIINCVFWRDDGGVLRGVLNHFPEGCWTENEGDFNVLVDPDYHRRGIGSALLERALGLYDIDLKTQHYTKEGAALVISYLKKRKIIITK